MRTSRAIYSKIAGNGFGDCGVSSLLFGFGDCQFSQSTRPIKVATIVATRLRQTATAIVRVERRPMRSSPVNQFPAVSCA